MGRKRGAGAMKNCWNQLHPACSQCRVSVITTSSLIPMYLVSRLDFPVVRSAALAERKGAIMRWLRVLSGIVCLVVLAGGPAFAQAVGATTGAINGKASDATGGVMPGVTVTISSPSMQGVRTAVTDTEGSYRFPAIPPGEYKITYELEGFSTVVREGIRVGLGFTATVNAELKVASLTESVTVTGASPVVDITSTKTSTN